MKYYFGKAFFAVVYLMLTVITGVAAISFSSKVMGLKIGLGVMNILVYAYFVFYYAMKTGEDAVKTLRANDVTRREIIRTGKDLEVKRNEEYKTWKGFFIGVLSCIPLVVLWIIHFIIVLATGKTATFAGGITITLYIVIAFFFNTDVKFMNFASSFYFTALYVPFVIILTGFGYILGAKVEMKRQAKIEEYQKQFSEDI